MKTSHYIIFTDPFSEFQNGIEYEKQIAFSTRSRQSLLLSSQICRQLQVGEYDDIESDVMEELTKHGFIVPDEANELTEIIKENKATIQDDSLLYFVIQPTAYCQLGCDYCGQEHVKKNLPHKTYDSILQRLEKKFIPGKHKALRIGWFGGEPLVGMTQIRELTALLMDFAEKHELKYSAKIVTNGLSLKENIFEELTQKLSCREFEVTLDGIAEFHDQRRHTKSKENTFDIIFKNLKTIIDREDFTKANYRLSIRCNVDKRNWEGVSPLIQLLADNGFVEKLAYFYPIGVYSWGNDAHTGSLTKEEFAEKEIDWLIEMIKVGFRPSLLPGRVKSVCLAVSQTSEMFDAFGNIFNCTEVSYVPKYVESGFVLGNLNTPTLDTNVRPLSDWNDRILNDGIPCSSCRMLPVCGGACPKSWSEDMRACPSNKFNIKEKLMLSYLSTKESFLETVQTID